MWRGLDAPRDPSHPACFATSLPLACRQPRDRRPKGVAAMPAAQRSGRICAFSIPFIIALAIQMGWPEYYKAWNGKRQVSAPISYLCQNSLSVNAKKRAHAYATHQSKLESIG
jgi:hypothetical protein